MIDLNDYGSEILDLLMSFRKDAQMAVQGEWNMDLSNENIESFQAQITKIDHLLMKIWNQN